ncbi:hypothetical protein ACJX0J_014729, partial [Zea mays]
GRKSLTSNKKTNAPYYIYTQIIIYKNTTGTNNKLIKNNKRKVKIICLVFFVRNLIRFLNMSQVHTSFLNVYCATCLLVRKSVGVDTMASWHLQDVHEGLHAHIQKQLRL